MTPRHKYTIGERVQYIPSLKYGNVPPGTYTIERILPSEGGKLQYRVKHATDGHERVMHESQLTGN